MNNLAGWICFGLGIALIGASYSNIKRATRSRRWPFVPGEVAISDVEPMGSGSEETWVFVFRYRYIAPDGAHSGHKLRFTPIPQTRSGAYALAKKYPVGKVMRVFYDPAKPSNCVIERGGSFGLLVLPLVALCFLAAGVVMLGWVTRPT